MLKGAANYISKIINIICAIAERSNPSDPFTAVKAMYEKIIKKFYAEIIIKHQYINIRLMTQTKIYSFM